MSTLSLQMGVGESNWRPQETRVRLWAGLVSVIITMLLLLALDARQQDTGATRLDEAKAVAVTIVPFYFPPMKPRAAAQADTAPLARQTTPAQRRNAVAHDSRTSRAIQVPQALVAVEPPVRPAEIGVPTAAAEQDAPASAPIRLDARTIRKANAASKSAIQLMAEGSGQDISSTVRSSGSVLQASVDAAKQPDCIPPDADGPGLLNLIFIPARIALSKCKFSGSR